MWPPIRPESVILEATAIATRAKVDGVIGLGGGSSLDVAKLVSILALGKEELKQIYGVGNAKGPRLPLILVPTTAGTGSEVTPISIVTTGTNEKMGVVSPVILPDIALLDPELTLGLPPHTTAATGIDAMVHAIEAYASINANNNPVSRLLATQALTLMGRSILKAVHARLRYRSSIRHASGLDVSRAGICEFSGSRRTCPGLSARWPFPYSAWIIECTGAAARPAFQRQDITAALRRACALCIPGPFPLRGAGARGCLLRRACRVSQRPAAFNLISAP